MLYLFTYIFFLIKIKVYGYYSLLSSLFCFYLMISCVKEIMRSELAKKTPNYNTIPNYLTYAMNSALCFFAVAGFLVALTTAILSFLYTKCFSNSRVIFIQILLYYKISN